MARVTIEVPATITLVVEVDEDTPPRIVSSEVYANASMPHVTPSDSDPFVFEVQTPEGSHETEAELAAEAALAFVNENAWPDPKLTA